jgi:5-methylcytosine-specific restriction enzyme A
MFSWLRRLTESFGGKPRSSQWPAVRKEHLRRFPTCAACGRSRDIEVHHVVPFSVAPERELDQTNLVSLCADPCHLLFGHLRNYQRHNRFVREDAAAFLHRMRTEP